MISAGNFVIENPLKPVITVTIGNTENRKVVSALIDTGAMRSFISSKYAAELNLEKVGTSMFAGSTSTKSKKTSLYNVNIQFPFNYVFENVLVGEAMGLIAKDYDFVIGMDIISYGDMLITNTDGKMMISLRFPSANERQLFPKY